MTFRQLNLLVRAGIAASFILAIATMTGNTASAQGLSQAMSITPKQTVDYEKPGVAVLKDCKFTQTKDPSGFVVHHSSGRLLRRFIDNNKDGKLDQWSYYDHGQEVYRDVDINYDGKTDQYRWIGEAGTRWGIDNDQNGIIDSWKVISAEEVAYECFQAIKNRDQDRFNRLLITPAEFSALKLNSEIASDIKERWTKARSNFLTMSRAQKSISSKSKWVYAGNGWPSMMPAGQNGGTDLSIYNHGAGFYENSDGSSAEQLAIGSMVKVGDVWRLIELPEVYDGKALNNGGAFFPLPDFGVESASPINKELVQLHEQLADVETKLKDATKPAEAERLEKVKSEILKKFVTATKDEKNRTQWVETFADAVASAYQGDRFEGGVKYLNDYAKANPNQVAIDYVVWRAIFAEYGWANMNLGRQEREKAHQKLIVQLKSFVQKYPKSKYTPKALVQIAVSYEVSDPDDSSKSLEWYDRCKRAFPATRFGKRSAGAIVRLNASGKTFPFVGKTTRGQPFELRSKQGKIVILHFWQTWCDDGIDDLVKVAEKFGDDVVIVSCNIEGVVTEEGVDVAASTKKFRDYMQTKGSKMKWIHLHSPGGVEYSELSHQLGVSTEPMVALIDRKGRLIETNLAFGSLEREIELERRRKD
jgi:thiol-disulfide isomerase/thioredoxin